MMWHGTYDEPSVLWCSMQQRGVELLATGIVKVNVDGAILLQNVPNTLLLIIERNVDAQLFEVFHFGVISSRTNDF